jgi:hypothetical protein
VRSSGGWGASAWPQAYRGGRCAVRHPGHRKPRRRRGERGLRRLRARQRLLPDPDDPRPGCALDVRGARRLLALRDREQQHAGLAGRVGRLAGLWNLRGELFGTASATRYRELPAASNVTALGRLHWATDRGGAWGGLGAGFVAQGPYLPDPLLQLDLGAWRRIGRTVYSLSATPTWLGRADALELPAAAGGRVDYTDYVAAMRWQHPSAEFAASAGARTGARPDGIPGARRWAETWTTIWVARRLAVVGGLGVFPTDVQQGLPGGRYYSAALRLATGRPPVNDPAVRAELTLPYELSRLRRGRANAESFTIAMNAQGQRVISVRVPGARQVEMMADFTDWLAVPLEPTSADQWQLVLAVSPGVHRVNLRVDGASGPFRPD